MSAVSYKVEVDKITWSLGAGEARSCTLPYPEGYQPSGFVADVVGATFRSMDERYKCVGYDPACGFWMVQVNIPETTTPRVTNISERAIGRTFHRVSRG